MYGAILGDIIGSRFEFDRGGWTKDFEMFTPECSFTDDTVMTVAVAEALLAAGVNADTGEIEKACIESMQKWGRKYPDAGYGSRFIGWLYEQDPKPYDSWGNGSAMRVAAAGWLYSSVERTRSVARATANVSHNHPEGLKGAECTAAVIYMARKGATKEEIREYVDTEFGYDLSKGVDELRPLHKHDESCMDALPKALVSFFEGNSFEDVIRNAVSLGGDTDTISAIAGAMAEGMYGVPDDLMDKCLEYLPDEMKQVIDDFSDKTGSMGRNVHPYIDVRYKGGRAKIIEILEKDGFVISDNAVRTKQEIIEAVLPLKVDMKEKTYDMMGNTTCAAAARSGGLMGANYFYRYYKDSTENKGE